MAVLDLRQADFREEAAGYLAPEDVFQRKYRHWRGRSGRSYVFSIYPRAECPPYEDAVVIVAARGARALACVDLGPLPDASLAGLRRRYAAAPCEVEFQIHVLADRRAERRTLIADLTPDA